jgi:hypothetical protein
MSFLNKVFSKKQTPAISHKCEICEKDFLEPRGKQLSPRQLSLMKPKNNGNMTTLIKSASLMGIASGIVQFNNPPGSSDTPMWWVCSDCLSNCF